MNKHHHGNLLVAVQAIALTVLVINAGPALRYWPSALALAVSAGLMFGALRSMGLTTFRFHPQPQDQGKLATVGLYRWLRHPMYTAAMIGSLVSTWMQPRLIAVVSLLAVSLVLYRKMCLEEAALREKFPHYASYAQKVPALIPFLPKSPPLRRACNAVILVALVVVTLYCFFKEQPAILSP